jgi:catechol 2,3-dioxygenase-like lactoylglutathione lyase family enzyme
MSRHTPPEGNPVARLSHAVLWVRYADVAVAFYRRVFGFEVVGTEMDGHAVSLRAAGGDNHHDLGLFAVGPDGPACVENAAA